MMAKLLIRKQSAKEKDHENRKQGLEGETDSSGMFVRIRFTS